MLDEGHDSPRQEKDPYKLIKTFSQKIVMTPTPNQHIKQIQLTN